MKKILSLILALSLIISVAPMSFADDVANEPIDEPGMYFNFSAAAYGSKTDIPAADIKTIDANKEYASIGTDPWYLTGQYANTDYRVTSEEPDTTNYPKSKKNALYWKTATYSLNSTTKNYQEIMVLELELNETGYFAPFVTFETGPNSAKYSFYLIDSSDITSNTYKNTYLNLSATAANMAKLANNAPMAGINGANPNVNLIKLGTVDGYATADKADEKTKELSGVFIPEKGNYYLYICGDGKHSSCKADSSNYYMNLRSFDMKPVVPTDSAKKDSAIVSGSASIAAYTVCGDGTPESIEALNVTYGEACKLEVPETKTVGEKTYNFLYWARGLEVSANRKIVSYDNNFTYRPVEGVNYLIAVYEDVVAGADKVEFFNGNGERMIDVTLDDAGNLPEYPYMAGYGQATGWKLHQEDGNGKVYEAGEAAPTEGTRIFVAQYDDPAEDITISINDVPDTYAYGDTVECKIDEGKKDTFSYWTKTIDGGKSEVVSLSETYKFFASENCTVKAVYDGKVKIEPAKEIRKILLNKITVGNRVAVMAEFIGFEDALEKGMLVEEYLSAAAEEKISMQTDGNQFIITNDKKLSSTKDYAHHIFSGYAIVYEDGEFVRYTDGSISVAGVK